MQGEKQAIIDQAMKILMMDFIFAGVDNINLRFRMAVWQYAGICQIL
jgi:hypothetical protein